MDWWLLCALIYATVGVVVAFTSPKEHERALLIAFGIGALVGTALYAAFN